MKNRKMRKFLKWSAFILYIAALVYFVFFAEMFGNGKAYEILDSISDGAKGRNPIVTELEDGQAEENAEEEPAPGKDVEGQEPGESEPGMEGNVEGWKPGESVPGMEGDLEGQE